jgi:hypothetical protein
MKLVFRATPKRLNEVMLQRSHQRSLSLSRSNLDIYQHLKTPISRTVISRSNSNIATVFSSNLGTDFSTEHNSEKLRDIERAARLEQSEEVILKAFTRLNEGFKNPTTMHSDEILEDLETIASNDRIVPLTYLLDAGMCSVSLL